MKHKYIGRFIIVGIAGFVFNSCVLAICIDYLGIGKIISEALAMLFALQLTFLLHDRWTYIDSTAGRKAYSWKLRKRYTTYLASNSFGSILTIVLFGVFSQTLPRLTALGIAALISMAWNFMANKVIVWRKPKNLALDELDE